MYEDVSLVLIKSEETICLYSHLNGQADDLDFVLLDVRTNTHAQSQRVAQQLHC